MLYFTIVVLIVILIMYCFLLQLLQKSQLATRMATNLMGQMELYENGECEEYFLANKITEEHQNKAMLLTFISSETYGLLQNLLSPAKPVE